MRDGADSSRTAELYANRYTGNWHRLLAALFSDDIRKVGHDVKDMMRALLERELPADGFVFDTALAAYLLDATAGKLRPAPAVRVLLQRRSCPSPPTLQPDAFSRWLGDVPGADGAAELYLRRQRPP